MSGNESGRQLERTAFNLYLRTGRRPDLPPPVQVEVKFNPWHDEEDGRFTFAGQGRYFPRGGGNRAQAGGTGASGQVQRPARRIAIARRIAATCAPIIPATIRPISCSRAIRSPALPRGARAERARSGMAEPASTRPATENRPADQTAASGLSGCRTCGQEQVSGASLLYGHAWREIAARPGQSTVAGKPDPRQELAQGDEKWL